MNYMYEDAKQKWEREFQSITDKVNKTPTDLEAAYKIIDILKDISTICAMDNYDYEEDWSGRNYSGRPRMSHMRGNYSGNYSGHNSDRTLDHLYNAMNEASSEEERMAIKALIDRHSR